MFYNVFLFLRKKIVTAKFNRYRFKLISSTKPLAAAEVLAEDAAVVADAVAGIAEKAADIVEMAAVAVAEVRNLLYYARKM